MLKSIAISLSTHTIGNVYAYAMSIGPLYFPPQPNQQVQRQMKNIAEEDNLCCGFSSVCVLIDDLILELFRGNLMEALPYQGQ